MYSCCVFTCPSCTQHWSSKNQAEKEELKCGEGARCCGCCTSPRSSAPQKRGEGMQLQVPLLFSPLIAWQKIVHYLHGPAREGERRKERSAPVASKGLNVSTSTLHSIAEWCIVRGPRKEPWVTFLGSVGGGWTWQKKGQGVLVKSDWNLS